MTQRVSPVEMGCLNDSPMNQKETREHINKIAAQEEAKFDELYEKAISILNKQ